MVKYTQVAPVLFGAGSVAVVGKQAQKLGITKALLVHGKSVTKNGTLEKIQKSLDDKGIAYVSFDEVKSDAPDYVCNKGGQLAKDENVDGVIAVGGGSALDAAKAIDILVTNPLPVSNYYRKVRYQKPAPLICIPTTSGTGSESTSVGIIYDTENDYKDAVIRGCELAILDPELTLSAPPQVTAGCALDAFAHALEAATAKGSNPRSDVLAYDAIKKITKNLKTAYDDGSDMAARSELALASNFAGIAFSDASVHIGHAIAHSFGVAFHMAHGEGCALTLPVVMKMAAKACPEKLLQITEAMGLQTEDIDAALDYSVSTVKALMADCNVPSLKERGITLEQALATVDYAFKEPLVAGNAPCEVTYEDMQSFITEIYEG